MKLASLTSDSHPYLERHVNRRSRTYSPFAGDADIADQYHPEHGITQFGIPAAELPREWVTLHTSDPDTALRDTYEHDGRVLLPIHPQLLDERSAPYIDHLRPYIKENVFTGQPTASPRTLYTAGTDAYPAHYIKCHYPRRLSRFRRRLRRPVIDLHLAINAEMPFIEYERFAYLPEVLGVTYGDDIYGIGTLIRESNARPHVDEERIYVPAFSLFSTDFGAEDDEPLLAQLIRYHDADPVEFTAREIVEPLIRSWCAGVDRGLIFECHAQNTLFELDRSYNVTRLVYRDFDDYIDPRIRNEKGLHINFSKDVLEYDEDTDPALIYSLNYDSQLGEHHLAYHAACIERFFERPATELKQHAQDLAHRYFPRIDDFLPSTRAYYENRLYSDNSFRVVDTGERPGWR